MAGVRAAGEQQVETEGEGRRRRRVKRARVGETRDRAEEEVVGGFSLTSARSQPVSCL